MRVLKNIFSQLHTFVLWALASVIFWGWIFGYATDTTFDKKIMVFCHVPAMQDTELALALEKDMPAGIKMVQVHTFDYVLFDTISIEHADVLLVPAIDIPEMPDELLPLEGEGGVPVYDAATGQGVLLDYITYDDTDYYLFLGAKSAHLEDGAAAAIARRMLAMQ